MTESKVNTQKFPILQRYMPMSDIQPNHHSQSLGSRLGVKLNKNNIKLGLKLRLTPPSSYAFAWLGLSLAIIQKLWFILINLRNIWRSLIVEPRKNSTTLCLQICIYFNCITLNRNHFLRVTRELKYWFLTFLMRVIFQTLSWHLQGVLLQWC